MRGDFSRLRFERNKHYTSVLEQQGRVALDADRNEQRVIDEDIRQTENIDIIGPFGGPRDDEGFAITIDGKTIQIGAGRYYVNGLLCENEVELSYGSQPYLIHPAIADSDLLTELSSGTIGPIRVFLEVWRRMVTALDDPCLREPALGQADTTTRLQTVWRVIAEPTLRLTPRPFPGPLNLATVARTTSTTLARAATIATTSAFTVAATVAGSGAVPTTGVGTGVAAGGASSGAGAAPATCCDQMYQPVETPAPGKLNAQTTGGSSDCSCQPTPAAGFRGLENQLYRVEIHHGGGAANATFKWSRENGSIVVAVTGVGGADVMVDNLGPDANLGFQVGEWVELSDDTYLFGPKPNQPGQMFQIKSINAANLTVTMTGPVANVDPARNARLRRWEQSGAAATANGVALAVTTWIDLENGIQVRFADGDFRTGDYWLIPARTASGQIEWPPCGSDGAAFQPPWRMDVTRAPLACIHWDAPTQKAIVDDCRRPFPSLTEISPEALSPAIHVNKINWVNDDLMTFEQLVKNGLAVSLDQNVTGRVDADNFIVTLEIPSPIGNAFTTGAAVGTTVLMRTIVAVDGNVKVQPGLISWDLNLANDPPAARAINALLVRGAFAGVFTRARVRLMGPTIFAGTGANQMFLDGRCFGKPGTRADGATPRTDLQLPSGSLQKASDFESWFFLVPVLELTGFTVSPAAVTVSPSQPNPKLQATLIVNYPPIADTPVQLSVTPPAGAGIAVHVPATVNIPRGKNSFTFDVGITNTQVVQAENFQVVASLPSSIGLSSTQIATVAVTGFVIIG